MKKTKLFLGTVALGLTLTITPPLALADTYYTVKPGDSLWKISNSYGITVEQIRELNSLDSALIFPGQSILVVKDADRSKALEVSRGASRVEKIINYAKSFTGVPYRYGGQSPAGFDCSGYILYVFRNFGIDLPRTAEDQFNGGRRVTEKEARPGDIVAFKNGNQIDHTGIYLGGGKFISATSNCGVEISSINGPYWSERLFGFSRIMP